VTLLARAELTDRKTMSPEQLILCKWKRHS